MWDEATGRLVLSLAAPVDSLSVVMELTPDFVAVREARYRRPTQIWDSDGLSSGHSRALIDTVAHHAGTYGYATTVDDEQYSVAIIELASLDTVYEWPLSSCRPTGMFIDVDNQARLRPPNCALGSKSFHYCCQLASASVTMRGFFRGGRGRGVGH